MNRIRLVVCLVALAFMAGCEQASYVSRLDRQTIRRYAAAGADADDYIQGLRPLTNGQAYVLNRDQWETIKTYAKLNAEHWRYTNAWALRFAPASEQPSQRCVDLAKSMVPQE